MVQIVILGFHRSGTSAVTQHLAHSGLFIGEGLLGASQSNPYGHFEDVEFFQINEDLLKSNVEQWLASDPFTPLFSRAQVERAQELVAKRTVTHEHWGFKDPRTCLFLDFWRLVLNRPRYLICLRRYEHCVDSIVRRAFNTIQEETKIGIQQDSMGVAGNFTQICLSWCNHMLRILELLKRERQNCLVVNLSEMDGDMSIAAAINERFGTELTSAPQSETFDPTIFTRSQENNYVIDGRARSLANRLWDDVIPYCDLPGG